MRNNNKKVIFCSDSSGVFSSGIRDELMHESLFLDIYGCSEMVFLKDGESPLQWSIVRVFRFDFRFFLKK